ncbi:MAG: Nif3-like dinuclear metal center hexameric protein [Desulfobacterales bacterium]|jgi:dinuclear metal center YbgI/SA1388 family protein
MGTGTTVAKIIEIMNQLAPPLLAEEWDNVGLQIGDSRQPVGRIWVALDPSPEVVKAACQKKVDLLITHHPLIFRPLKSIDFDTPGGSIIQMAAHHQLAIFSAHTNLDIVRDGVNDVLAQQLGLRNLTVLNPVEVEERAKEGATPLTDGEAEYGIGRIGSLTKASSLRSLVSMVKKKLKLDFIKVAGDLEMKVKWVAICSGSGSSLMQAFLASKAQAYISGDIHYHDAREAEAVNRAIIDIGHFPSEHLMVDALAKQLEKVISKQGIEAEIMACTIEKDPFRII